MSKSFALDADNIYFKHSPENFKKLLEIVNSNFGSAVNIIRAKGFFRGNAYHASAYEDLRNWIDAELPLLSDSKYSYSTKICWILHGFVDFPKCKNSNCNNKLTHVNAGILGYRQEYCSKACAAASLEVPREQSKSKALAKSRNIDALLEGLSHIDKLKLIAEKFPDSYPMIVKAREDLYDFVMSNTSCLDSSYKMSTRLFWVMNSISSWKDERVCCRTCGKPLFGKNVSSVAGDFPHFCNSRCAMLNDEVQQKVSGSSLKQYGVAWPSASREAIIKARSPYLYDGIYFKSSWELAVLIFCRDHGIQATYNPDVQFQYEHNGVAHTYHPDFMIDGKLVEVKGNHFLTADGKMQNPFDHSQDSLYEAKHQCMMSHSVEVLEAAGIQKHLNYANETYGANYLKSFKVDKLKDVYYSCDCEVAITDNKGKHNK